MIVAMARSGSLLFYNVLLEEKSHSIDGKEEFETVKSLELKGAASVVGLLSAAIILVVFAKSIHEFTDSVAKQIFDNYTYQNQVLGDNTVDPLKGRVE